MADTASFASPPRTSTSAVGATGVTELSAIAFSAALLRRIRMSRPL